MRKLMLVLTIGVSCLTLSVKGWSATFLTGVSEASGWYDVNKADVYGTDSLMCWAASSSNLLAYAKWYGWDSGSNSLIDSPGGIYGVFTSHWSNDEGAPFYGYEWWMTDRATSIVNAAKQLDGGGLDFYPTVHVNRSDIDPDTVTMYTNNFSLIKGYVDNGTGVSLSITVPNSSGIGTYSHSLTLWGYDDTYIWITDSDDTLNNTSELDKYQYSVDGSGAWTILGYNNVYTNATNVTITQVTRLNYNKYGPDESPLAPNQGGDSGVVPEPSSVVLLGSGLVGLIAVVRLMKP
jgi:hypothetical protein